MRLDQYINIMEGNFNRLYSCVNLLLDSMGKRYSERDVQNIIAVWKFSSLNTSFTNFENFKKATKLILN